MRVAGVARQLVGQKLLVALSAAKLAKRPRHASSSSFLLARAEESTGAHGMEDLE